MPALFFSEIVMYFEIRNIQARDAAAIQHIQAACYPAELQESIEALQAKSQLSPASCWIAMQQHSAIGYLFSHPWQGQLPPALDHVLTSLPDRADALFLHDLAILPQARGLGVAQALLEQANRWARSNGLRTASLVAVRNSHAFWKKKGFGPPATSMPQLQAKLQAYGPDAHCLCCDVLHWQATAEANC